MKTQFDKGCEKGASQAIKKIMREIEAILEGTPLQEAGECRTELREKIEDSLIELASKWYRTGFRRGHKVAFERYAKFGILPKKLSKIMNCKFLPNIKESVRLSSVLTPKFQKNIFNKHSN